MLYKIIVSILNQKRKIVQTVEANCENDARTIAYEIAAGRGFAKQFVTKIKIEKLAPPHHVEF